MTITRDATPEAAWTKIRAMGLKIGSTADVVDGAMRCLCDESVAGRAVCIVGGEANGVAPGAANFDLRDDLSNHFGGEALFTKVMQGFFMPLPEGGKDEGVKAEPD